MMTLVAPVVKEQPATSFVDESIGARPVGINIGYDLRPTAPHLGNALSVTANSNTLFSVTYWFKVHITS